MEEGMAVRPETTNKIQMQVEMFLNEDQAFTEKGNKSAARRARGHLSELMKLAKLRRAEITSEVNAL